MVFCNIVNVNGLFELLTCHNPYFNRWFSAIVNMTVEKEKPAIVTILILIDGFLQCVKND